MSSSRSGNSRVTSSRSCWQELLAKDAVAFLRSGRVIGQSEGVFKRWSGHGMPSSGGGRRRCLPYRPSLFPSEPVIHPRLGIDRVTSTHWHRHLDVTACPILTPLWGELLQ